MAAEEGGLIGQSLRKTLGLDKNKPKPEEAVPK
jgi:hypothetical protein